MATGEGHRARAQIFAADELGPTLGEDDARARGRGGVVRGVRGSFFEGGVRALQGETEFSDLEGVPAEEGVRRRARHGLAVAQEVVSVHVGGIAGERLRARGGVRARVRRLARGEESHERARRRVVFARRAPHARCGRRGGRTRRRRRRGGCLARRFPRVARRWAPTPRGEAPRVSSRPLPGTTTRRRARPRDAGPTGSRRASRASPARTIQTARTPAAARSRSAKDPPAPTRGAWSTRARHSSTYSTRASFEHAAALLEMLPELPVVSSIRFVLAFHHPRPFALPLSSSSLSPTLSSVIRRAANLAAQRHPNAEGFPPAFFPTW